MKVTKNRLLKMEYIENPQKSGNEPQVPNSLHILQ